MPEELMLSSDATLPTRALRVSESTIRRLVGGPEGRTEHRPQNQYPFLRFRSGLRIRSSGQCLPVGRHPPALRCFACQ